MARDISKRELLRYTALLGAAGISWPCGASFFDSIRSDSGYSTPENLLSLIRDYDEMGWHRTGSEGDVKTHVWLKKKIHNLGFEPEENTFSFRRVTGFTAALDIAGETIQGLPLFDTLGAPSGTQTGSLGLMNSGQDFIVLKAPPYYGLPGGQALLDLRAENACKGIIAITDAVGLGLKPGLTPVNADAYKKPFGPPVILVSSEQAANLLKAAAEQQPVAFKHDIKRQPGKSSNIIAEVPGRDPGLKPFVVMTPMTGWWHCASERGSGLALWLRLLAAVAKTRPDRTFLFAATAGHELGHMGLAHLLQTRIAQPDSVYAWLHLGACFCGKNTFTQLQASSPELAETAASIMQSEGLIPNKSTTSPHDVVGEVKDVIPRGGKYLSISGFDPWFHNQRDRIDQSIDVPRVAAMSRVVEAWLSALLA